MYAIDGETFLRSSSAAVESCDNDRKMSLKMILLKFVVGMQYWEA
jgi:hypothetical protein